MYQEWNIDFACQVLRFTQKRRHELEEYFEMAVVKQECLGRILALNKSYWPSLFDECGAF